jgi:hypothetical protein
MTRLSPDARRMVQALREERMSDGDRARLRARVIGVGAVVSAGAVAAGVGQAKAMGTALAGTVAAETASVGTGVAMAAAPVTLGKLVTAGLAWKVSVATLVIASAVPLVQLTTAANQVAKTSATHEQAHGETHVDVAVRARDKGLEGAPPVAMILPSAEPQPPAEPTSPVESSVAEAPHVALRKDSAERAPRSAQQPRPASEPQTPPGPTVASADESGSLARESALIESALRTLRDGDREAARRLLDEHQLHYPHGALAPERERTRARLNTQVPTFHRP